MKAKGISRRDFIKGAAAGAVGVATMGILGACTGDDGTTGTTGTAGTISTSRAETTRQETSRSTLESTTQMELESTSAAASNVPVTAAAEDWLGEAPRISDGDCVETVDTEVLVVGAGCAGLFAACAAAEEGAAVLLIEKLPIANGVRSSALSAVGSRLQTEAGAVIDKTEIINDICHYALNHNDMSLVKVWADNSGETLDWYTDFINERGKCEVILEYTMPGEETRYKMWPTGHGTKAINEEDNAEAVVSEDMIEYLTGYDGCEYRTQTALQCVIKEGEKVVGVYATNSDGDYIRINADKGVIIASGGYSNNEEMYTALQPETKKSLVGLMTFPGATGDGIKVAIWAGAKFDEYHSTMIFDRGIIAPDAKAGDPYNGGMPYFHIATQPFLKVNKAGKRICNESSPYDFIVHAAANYEGKAWYQIFDSNWRDDVTRFHTIGCSTIPEWEGGNHHPEGLDAVEETIAGYVEAGLCIKADTIEELAEAMGINSERLQVTVDRYNELYDAGEDSDFGKETFRLSSLRTPPYYGAKLGGLILCTMDGVQIDTNGQAIGEDDKLIDGLFVIGNDSGKYYTSSYPNFGAGTNAGRCATFGRVCGKYVASL